MFNRLTLSVTLIFLTGVRCALANGFEGYGTKSFGTVVVIEIADQSDVSATLILAAGGAEDGQQEGLAHFAEHRAFAGAALATSYRGSLNGFTTLETTEFSGVFDPASLPYVLEFYGSLLKNVDLPEERLERERDRILYEITVGENNPISRSEICAARREMYVNAPWKNCIIGQRFAIKTLEAEEISSFQSSHYSRENAILVIAGAVDVQEVEKLLPRTGPTVWRGLELPVPEFKENLRETWYESSGRLIVAYRTISLPGNSNMVEQSVALTYLSVWDLGVFETQLSHFLQGEGFLARNFDLIIQPSGGQKALVTVIVEMESGVDPENVITALEKAIDSVDNVRRKTVRERRDVLVRAFQKPEVYHSFLLAHLRNRRKPFEVSAYSRAMTALQAAEIQRIHDSLFQSEKWQFLIPSSVR